jgi:hypothetical protein
MQVVYNVKSDGTGMLLPQTNYTQARKHCAHCMQFTRNVPRGDVFWSKMQNACHKLESTQSNPMHLKRTTPIHPSTPSSQFQKHAQSHPRTMRCAKMHVQSRLNFSSKRHAHISNQKLTYPVSSPPTSSIQPSPTGPSPGP